MSSFCNAKATHIFAAKKYDLLENTLATTANKFVINKLVKLTMLWTTGPWSRLLLSIKRIIGYNRKQQYNSRVPEQTVQKHPHGQAVIGLLTLGLQGLGFESCHTMFDRAFHHNSFKMTRSLVLCCWIKVLSINKFHLWIFFLSFKRFQQLKISREGQIFSFKKI